MTGASSSAGGRTLLTRATDDVLLEAARAGDRSAFDELVRRTYRGTYGLALRLMGDPDDARDVTQKTYLRAFRGLDRFRGDAQFTTWLYRITANRAATHLRWRIRNRHEELPADLGSVSDEGFGGDADLRHDLGTALRCLPPKLRVVVVLHDVYGLTHGEIAEDLSISESASKVRLHRARHRLRSELFPMESRTGSAGHDVDGDRRAM